MSQPTPVEPSPLRTDRLLPIDWARGLAMVFMAVDHASAILNRGRVVPGSRNLNGGATSFPDDQFFLRWVTHICPVAFIFLAGVSIVLMARRRTQKGIAASAIERSLLVRGVIIVLLDFLWLNAFGGYQKFRLDVLTAIGIGFIVLAFARRLPRAAMALLAGLFVLTPEIGGAFGLPTWLANVAFDGGGASPRIFFDYPIAPWVGVMMMGYLWGAWLLDKGDGSIDVGRYALRTLAPLLLVYLVIRGFNGWGNAHAPRIDDSLQQWLNVSKNPPSLSFLALELSILGAGLTLLSWIASRGARLAPLAVFGQTALFFYLIHFPLLLIGALLTKTIGSLLIPGALLGALLLVLAMYPICRLYAAYKRGHDNPFTRYI